MSKYIFSPESIEVDKPRIFDIPRGSEVIANHFQFGENQVSKIEIERIKFIPDTIFINLYNENTKIGNVVTKEVYELDIDINAGTQYYYLNQANEYYEEV